MWLLLNEDVEFQRVLQRQRVILQYRESVTELLRGALWRPVTAALCEAPEVVKQHLRRVLCRQFFQRHAAMCIEPAQLPVANTAIRHRTQYRFHRAYALIERRMRIFWQRQQ